MSHSTIKFPEDAVAEVYPPAAFLQRRRSWIASAAKWAVPALLVTGGLLYASRSIANCVPTIHFQTHQAPARVPSADDEVWQLWGYRDDSCDSQTKFYVSGTKTQNCTGSERAFVPNSFGWENAARSEFKLCVYGDGGCQGEATSVEENVACDEMLWQSYKVINSIGGKC